MVNLKALVIDDSRVMRNMVMQALKKANLAEFEFVEAEDGQDGLNKFDPDEFHIGFVDWNMPNMNGVDFVRAVRKREEGDADDRIPLVMVTSEKTMSKIEEALDEAGADAFICKPFTPEELAVKLKKVIEKASQVAIRRARMRREMAEPVKSGGLFGGLFG